MKKLNDIGEMEEMTKRSAVKKLSKGMNEEQKEKLATCVDVILSSRVKIKYNPNCREK
jgi:hypothetical protein